MRKNKAAVKCEIKPWLSAKLDCREGRFLQIGNSLLLSEKFQDLSHGARFLYLAMALESGGRKDFTFPLSAAKKYGIPSSSLRKMTDELVNKSFITRTSLANLRKPNEYSFSFNWKSDTLP